MPDMFMTSTMGLSVFKPAYELIDIVKIGDLIEFDRTLYSHWAIYVGGGEVVHAVGEDGEDLPDNEYAVVRKDSLIAVAGHNYVRLNNKDVPAKERGLASFDGERVTLDSLKTVGYRVPYNLLTNNIEHFVTRCKYGVSWSDQAAVAMQAIKALRKDTMSSGHTFLVNSLKSVLDSPGAYHTPVSPLLLRSPSSSLSSTASQTEPVS